MRRSQPLLLVAVFAVAIAGIFVLGRGDGGAQRIDTDAAAGTTPGGSPLDKPLTAAQLARFERATSNLSLVVYADALPAKRGKELVRSACAALDDAVPLLDALRGTCLPTLRLSDATRAMRKACPGGVGCAASLRRRAATLRALGRADRAFARAVRRAIPAGECREAIAPIHTTISAEFALARADERMADAIVQHDRPALDEARRTGNRHADTFDEDLVWWRSRDMAKACNVEPWAFQTAA